jgi:eukaryotic-like serine/threonine-protein kinase
VMLTPDGKVKVMDFGIARATTSETITQTAAVVGTAQYISPEQAQGQAVDYRSDIYSLGCCLYEMLTGTVPFTGATPVAIAYRHVREDPTPPRMLNADVPAPLEAICLKAMAKLPDNRYQTAAEFQSDLERFRNGQPVQATPLLDAAATTQAIPRGDGGADPTAMLGGATAADGYAEPYEEERRTSVGWIVVSVLALLAVGAAAFFITRALTNTDTPTATTVATTATTQAATTTEATTTTQQTTTTEPPTTTTERQTTTTTEPPTTTTEPPTTSEPTDST